MASAFQANIHMIHIRTKLLPVQSRNSTTIVERCHSPIRRAYNIIRKECSKTDEYEFFQMTVKAINDCIGFDYLVPTRLVFGALPRLGLPTDRASKSTFQRAVALLNATEAMSKQFLERQVIDAMHTQNGPDVTDIHTTSIGSHTPFLVYQPEKDKQEGLYLIPDLKEAYVIILTPKKAQKFCITVIKPYITNSSDSENYVNSQYCSCVGSYQPHELSLA